MVCLGTGSGCSGCIEVRSVRAERRMQRLSVYDLGGPSAVQGSCSTEDLSRNVGSDGKAVDIFAEEQVPR